jgi:O-antigen/teichoic acid export membrane protein
MGAQAVILSCTYLLMSAWLYGRPVWTLKTAELAAGTSFCLSQSSRAMQSNMDRMVLSRFADSAALGIYSAASRILQLGLFPIQVAMRTVYANFYVHGAKGLNASRNYALQVAPALLGIGIFSAVSVAIAAFLAPLILGKDFAETTSTTIRLAYSLPLIALQYPAADALSGAGRQSLRAHIYVLAAAGFGFLLVGGVKLGGINGLIYAFLLGHFLLAAVLWACTFVCAGHSSIKPATQ